MDGGQRRQATAVARAQGSPARRLIAWLQLFFSKCDFSFSRRRMLWLWS
jgi:hypothetical protein